MRLSDGISPVISTIVLLGAVLILGISFMTYSISLSNAQSSEIRLRNALADESAKVVIFIEKDDSTRENIILYLGLTKVIPEPAKYYLTLFKSNEYGTFSGLIPLSPAEVSVSVKPPDITAYRPPTGVSAMKIYMTDATGNYVPLMGSGLNTLYVYEVLYEPTPLNLTLIKINVGKALVTGFKYIVPVLLMDYGDEYYEIARLYYLMRG